MYILVPHPVAFDMYELSMRDHRSSQMSYCQRLHVYKLACCLSGWGGFVRLALLRCGCRAHDEGIGGSVYRNGLCAWRRSLKAVQGSRLLVRPCVCACVKMPRTAGASQRAGCSGPCRRFRGYACRNLNYVDAIVQHPDMVHRFFEFLNIESPNNNIHNIRVCRILVATGAVPSRTLSELQIPAKVCPEFLFIFSFHTCRPERGTCVWSRLFVRTVIHHPTAAQMS